MSRNNKFLIILIAVMAVVLTGLVAFAMNMQPRESAYVPETTHPTVATTQPATEASEPTEPSIEETTEPTEPPMEKIATATVGATGDILMHDLVIQGGYDKETDSYDYNYMFTEFSRYLEKVDFAVANLEVTLCGSDNGYRYSGYPQFNCPDPIVDALQNAGFDMLINANNHSYDTGNKGFHRTQQVLAEKNMPYIGSRPAVEDKPYKVVDVNGIQIGMINYTYNTGTNTDGSVSLNGIKLSADNSKLINTFDYNRLTAFYTELENRIADMRSDGAEAIILYIHWGNEYQTKENSIQNKMAQAICNLGVDVIVGNHAHVPQPVELLTNENDENKKTLCLYSTGNAVSNIRKSSKFPVNVEDGMLFTFTFAKYTDGTVIVESTRVIPTWVDRYTEGNTRKFRVLVMDDTVDDWQADMDLTDALLKTCESSYERTMNIVGEGIDQANDYYTSNQQAVETALGIA